jgi:uncharacterized membrane-anchored protein
MERAARRRRIPNQAQNIQGFGAQIRSEKAEVGEMSDAKDVLRVAGMVLLGIFVIAVGIPLVFKAAGITLGIIGLLIVVAVFLIKVAVVIAIGYLIIVGIRALLR